MAFFFSVGRSPYMATLNATLPLLDHEAGVRAAHARVIGVIADAGGQLVGHWSCIFILLLFHPGRRLVHQLFPGLVRICTLEADCDGFDVLCGAARGSPRAGFQVRWSDVRTRTDRNSDGGGYLSLSEKQTGVVGRRGPGGWCCGSSYNEDGCEDGGKDGFHAHMVSLLGKGFEATRITGEKPLDSAQDKPVPLKAKAGALSVECTGTQTARKTAALRLSLKSGHSPRAAGLRPVVPLCHSGEWRSQAHRLRLSRLPQCYIPVNLGEDNLTLLAVRARLLRALQLSGAPC
jgi:hypothetical protein